MSVVTTSILFLGPDIAEASSAQSSSALQSLPGLAGSARIRDTRTRISLSVARRGA